MSTSKPAPRRSPRTSTAKSSNEKPSTTDQMAEDASATTVEYPDGAPEFLVPLAVRPRTRRAEFKRRYARVLEGYERADKLRKALDEDNPPMSDQMKIMAELDDVYQGIVDMLAIAAVDPEKYQVWADEVEDAELLQAFNAYNVRTQPGEASSSTS
jgi:hypothetical protein